MVYNYVDKTGKFASISIYIEYVLLRAHDTVQIDSYVLKYRRRFFSQFLYYSAFNPSIFMSVKADNRED
jgi:hypothetical protein